MQVNHGVKKHGTIVAVSSRGLAYRIAVLVYDGEKFFCVVVHAV